MLEKRKKAIAAQMRFEKAGRYRVPIPRTRRRRLVLATHCVRNRACRGPAETE